MADKVYSVDNNILKTIRALGSVKPDGVVISVEFSPGMSITPNGLNTNGKGFLLVFTFESRERFGLEYPTMQEALRQKEYFDYLLKVGSGKFKLAL